MATAFRPKAGRVRGRLNAQELDVVVHMLRSVRDFVAPEQEATGDPLQDLMAGLGGSDDARQPPQDPALLRLLPVAHRDDEAHAQEFRALTEHSVRQHKTSNLDTAIEALTAQGSGTIELDQRQAGALMIGLTDVRLVLGERLQLRTDEDTEAMHEQIHAAAFGEHSQESSEPDRLQQMALYDFLTWLQESLAISLLGD
ncbi:MAG: DUF2017 domain-containing protein [Ornithinimicrobium sp.]